MTKTKSTGQGFVNVSRGKIEKSEIDGWFISLAQENIYGSGLRYPKGRPDDAKLLMLNLHEKSTIFVQIEDESSVLNGTAVNSAIKRK